MKLTTLTAFMLLTFLQSNGQSTTGKADGNVLSATNNNNIKPLRIAYDPTDGLDISYPIQIGPKYDTVRVLIAYADTTFLSGVTYHAYRDTDKNITIGIGTNHIPIIFWSFVYSVREKGVPLNRCFGCSELVPRHIKYLTEDKKPIPSTWVELWSKDLEKSKK